MTDIARLPFHEAPRADQFIGTEAEERLPGAGGGWEVLASGLQFCEGERVLETGLLNNVNLCEHY